MGPTEHCRRSPSKAESWINCPPSLVAGEAIEEESSSFAEAGTAAHALGEWKGKKALKLRAGRRPTSDLQDEEMEGYTDDYAQFLCDLTGQITQEHGTPKIMFEQHVELKDPAIWGTCDFLVIAAGQMYVVDLKYGYMEVSATENFQLMIYGLSALTEFDCLYDITDVHLIIFQPRIQNISRWDVTAKDLYAWGENVLKPAAELADKGEGEYNPGPWCSHNFCKCRNVCRARVEKLLDVAKYEFSDPPMLSDDEIAQIMKQADELNKWCQDVFSYAQGRALEGKKWPGYKLVSGRSVRKFTDADEVEAACKKAGYTDIYQPRTLITLTAMEKLLGSDFEDVLGKYITRTEPKLTLVEESDKREEVVIANAVDEFS